MPPFSTPILAELSARHLSSLQDRMEADSGLIATVYGAIILIGLVVDAGLVLYVRRHPLRWRERVAAIQWRPWDRQEGLLLAGFLLVAQLLLLPLAPVLEQWAEATGLLFTSVSMIAQSVILHILGLGLIAALVARNGVRWGSAFGLKIEALPRNVIQGVLFFFALMPPLLFYTAIYHASLNFFGQELQPQEVTDAISMETSPLVRLYFLFLATMLAPVFEEMLFRGVGLAALSKRFGMGVSIVIVSLLFALIHAHLPSFLPLFLLSVGLCLGYVISGSLLVPIVIHSLFNSVTMTLLLLMPS